MIETRILMGMPVTVEIVDSSVAVEALNRVFAYFEYVDEKFSTYKATSEITRINEGQLDLAQSSADMKTIFALAAETREQTDGHFDIARDGIFDPSGIVKGWAIYNAAQILHEAGFRNYYVDAGGDIQIAGKNRLGENWRVGIRNPFNMEQFVKALSVTNCGVATSGTYVRGAHIYNPRGSQALVDEIVSLTVIGPNIYDADRFATAAFAMGREGIHFIADLPGFEGYMIDRNGQAVMTGGFEGYVIYDETY